MERNSENPIEIEISELIPSGENELHIFGISSEDSGEPSGQLSQELTKDKIATKS